MQDRKLIVCEKTGRWARALRRELPRDAAEMTETRSVGQGFRAFFESSAPFLAIELTIENVEDLVKRCFHASRVRPQGAVAVLGDRRASRFEWLMRECGAAHVCLGMRRIGALARLVDRHFRHAPHLELPPTERVLASLPWRPHGR